MACRFAAASVVMIPVCYFLKAVWPKSRRQVIHILIASFLVQTVYLMGVYSGINLGVSTGVTALVVGRQPLLTGVLAGALLQEKVTARNWIGLSLGFAGLALVVWDRVAAPGESLWGLGLCVIALLGITFGTLYQKKFCGPFDVRAGVALQNVISGIVIVALAYSFETMEIASPA